MRRYACVLGLVVLLVPWAVSARTWYIAPDGLGDVSTIQVGIDAAAAGDTVLLGNGLYTGVGNRDLDFLGKPIMVRSHNGDPEACVIDCQGSEAEPHRGFWFHSEEDPASVLEGVKIVNGYAPADAPSSQGHGGGIFCDRGTSPTFKNCTFSGNSAGIGGGISCMGSSPTISGCGFSGNSADGGGGLFIKGSPSGACTTKVINCSFSGNQASMGGGILRLGGGGTLAVTDCIFGENEAEQGGGFYCGRASPVLTNCVFIGNVSTYGGGMYCMSRGSPALSSCTFYGNSAEDVGSSISCVFGCEPNLENSIIAFGTAGQAIYCDVGSSATLSCCDVYGNAGGDWVGCIAGQYGTTGNFSADPRFCDPGTGDLHLWSDSGCAPGNHPDGSDCDLIGAFGVACGIEVVALVDIDPNVLNSKSGGRWVTCHICLPEGYDAHDIDVSTVQLNETVRAESHPTAVHSSCLMVKFSRSAVIEAVPCGEEVEVRVTGDVASEPFVGSSIVRVLCRELKPESCDRGNLVKTSLGLSQANPSPFSGHSMLRFSLTETQRVRFTIYDVRGRLVGEILDEVRSTGSHSIEWDGRDGHGYLVGPGVYFIRLQAGHQVATRKIVLMR